MFRFISIAIRKLKAGKKEKKLLCIYNNWLTKLPNASTDRPTLKKLLIIRLDDIGDYMLFRNCLSVYKHSARWQNYSVSLLGNIAWKELFDKYDSNTVDKTIWIDKKSYLTDENYKIEIWKNLNSQLFEVVICPSRTRPLLLDDFCALATNAPYKIAAANTFEYAAWNQLSDNLYTELFILKNSFAHEVAFNKAFTEWCCYTELNEHILRFDNISENKIQQDYFICFIGASAKSKRWPIKKWIALINLIKKTYNNKILIAGGKQDIERANKIAGSCIAKNITGKTSLNEMITLIAVAKAVITNDTMAAHAAVACNTPVIIVSGGNNYYRFTAYDNIYKKVMTIYPEIFLNKLKRTTEGLINYEAVSADIATISAKVVFEALKKLLQ